MCLHYRGHPHAVRAAGPGPCGLALASPPLAFIMDRERRYIGVPLLAVPPDSLASRSKVPAAVGGGAGGTAAAVDAGKLPDQPGGQSYLRLFKILLF
jgi:hypothetical protein